MGERPSHKKHSLWAAAMRCGGLLGCHQRPDRSFFFKGRQFPVCARCTGVILGYALGAALFFASLRPPLWLSLLLMTVMLADWLLQYWGIFESTNLRRLLTGLSGGLGTVTAVLTAVLWVLKRALF